MWDRIERFIAAFGWRPALIVVVVLVIVAVFVAGIDIGAQIDAWRGLSP